MEKTTELFELWNKEKVLLDNTNSSVLKVKKDSSGYVKFELIFEVKYLKKILLLDQY